MKRLLLLIALVFLTVTSGRSFAYYDKAVLGTSIQIADTVFPPITAGPGHILPDSPFYFVDKLYQEARLALVFTPENRAQLHTEIAAERLAELRVEAMRSNQTAVDAALLELQHESIAAANDIRDAASQGKDVTQLARNIHQALKDYQTVLTTVQAQVPDTSFGQKLASASDVLRDARIISEDALPQSDLDHEIAANVDAEVDSAVLGVKTSVDALQKKMSLQQSLASKAAEKKAQKEQIEAIKQSTKEKEAAVRAERKKAIQEYLAKVEALRKQRETELDSLKKTIKSLQEQLRQLNESEKTEIKNIREGSSSGSANVKVTPKPTITPSNSTLRK